MTIIPHDCGPVETCDCVNPPRVTNSDRTSPVIATQELLRLGAVNRDLRAENERLRAHVKDAETVLELGKVWWLARGHSRAVAEAAFGEAVGSYDPAAYQR